MQNAELLKGKNKSALVTATRWLKERGINPHVCLRDIKTMCKTKNCDYVALFDPYTGHIEIPNDNILRKVMPRSYSMVNIIAHELTHRGDYIGKFWGSKKLRRVLYKKWKTARDFQNNIEAHEKEHKEHMDAKHPLYQAAAEMDSKGYDAFSSLLKLWCADPETFEKMLEMATAIRAVEAKGLKKLDKNTVQKIKEYARKNLGIIKLNNNTIRKIKNNIKNYFMQTPVNANKKRLFKYFLIFTEIPAYMIGEFIMGKRPEEGLKTAKEMVTSKKYFKGTEMEGVARKAADSYKRLAEILREASCNDEEIVQGIIHIHKNIYTPEDLERLLKDEETIIRAAKAVKVWRGTEDIREGIAAQGLGRMDENVTKVLDAIKKKKHQKKNSIHLNQK